MKRWFALQRCPSGATPVTWDERPRKGSPDDKRIIEGTLREIPLNLRDKPLAEIAAWAFPPAPVMIGFDEPAAEKTA